jgi:hypothetical protein
MNSFFEEIKYTFNVISEIPESFRNREIKDNFDCLILMDDDHLLVIRENYHVYQILSTKYLGIQGGMGACINPIDTIRSCFKMININIHDFPIKEPEQD